MGISEDDFYRSWDEETHNVKKNTSKNKGAQVASALDNYIAESKKNLGSEVNYADSATTNNRQQGSSKIVRGRTGNILPIKNNKVDVYDKNPWEEGYYDKNPVKNNNPKQPKQPKQSKNTKNDTQYVTNLTMRDETNKFYSKKQPDNLIAKATNKYFQDKFKKGLADYSATNVSNTNVSNTNAPTKVEQKSQTSARKSIDDTAWDMLRTQIAGLEKTDPDAAKQMRENYIPYFNRIKKSLKDAKNAHQEVQRPQSRNKKTSTNSNFEDLKKLAMKKY